MKPKDELDPSMRPPAERTRAKQATERAYVLTKPEIAAIVGALQLLQTVRRAREDRGLLGIPLSNAQIEDLCERLKS